MTVRRLFVGCAVSEWNRSLVGVGLLMLASLLPLAAPANAQEPVWAGGLGGVGVAVDGSGSVYTTGYFTGVVDFDLGPGVFELTSDGSRDIFVSKLDSAGNFLWARRLGGATIEVVAGVAVDGDGNVYTTGLFQGTIDLNPGPGVFNLSSEGGFVSKLNSSGNFIWARKFNGGASVKSITVDGGGNVYTTGYFLGPVDFDPGNGVFTLTSPGTSETFVSKLNRAGNFVWARQLGGGVGSSVAVDQSGNVVITGSFFGTSDLDPGPSVFTLVAAGGIDIFVAKLDSAGDFAWARPMGGAGQDGGTGVALDAVGNIYAAGSFSGAADFGASPNLLHLTSSGSWDIFVCKLDSAGNFVWTRQWGGTAQDTADGLAVDAVGNVYTTGFFSDTADFDPGPGVLTLNSAGGIDYFLSKLDSAGNLVWASQTGGETPDAGASVAADGMGYVYVTGVFNGTVDFDPSSRVLELTAVGNQTFVSKYTGVTGVEESPVISEGGIVLATLLPHVGTISPLSIISVFGENFSTGAILFPNLNSQGKIDTLLGDACLLMNNEPLPIFAVTPEQINAQVSAAKTLGPASFVVVANCDTPSAIRSAPLTVEWGRAATLPPLASGPETVTVEEATPGFFLFPPLAEDGLVAARFAGVLDPIAVAPDGMFVDQYGTSRPAKPGDIIVLYGTGWGETTAGLEAGELSSGAATLLPEANPTVTFGGVVMDPNDVLYVGVAGSTAGLYQLAIRIPAAAAPGRNQVVLRVYGKSTPTGPVVPVAEP